MAHTTIESAARQLAESTLDGWLHGHTSGQAVSKAVRQYRKVRCATVTHQAQWSNLDR